MSLKELKRLRVILSKMAETAACAASAMAAFERIRAAMRSYPVGGYVPDITEDTKMIKTRITFDALRSAHWFCAAVGDNGPCTQKEWVNRIEKWKKESDPVDDRLAHPLFYDRVLHTWKQDGHDVEFMEDLK